MYTFEYRFYPKSFETPSIDDFDDSMQWFLSALYKNGQILEHFQNSVKRETSYACRVTAPELDSLDEKYWNIYCKKFYKEVIDQSRRKPSLRLIGENYDVPDCCTCEDPNHYILYCNFISYTTPVICGDCHQAVPLYKLPKTYYGEEYYDLYNWQKVYESCDRQFMEGIGERHGYRMMHDPNSMLAQEGIRICRFLEKETGKPFYYYLFQYYRKNKPVCPICGNSWVNDDHTRIKYPFVCVNCRVLSEDII